ncbi:hypothetical protein RIM49_002365 [Enterobacter kobei]|nr:hypothetical protein [Enterobacter kobei]
MSTITIDPRDEFEKVFPIPSHVIRCGKGYACTEYNAWGGHDFIRKWEGWSAAMLQSFGNSEQLNSPVIPDGLRLALSNAGIAAPESDEMLAATCEKCIQALVTWVKERKPFRSAVIPDGWVMMPVEPTEEMLDEFDSIIDYGAEDSKDAWSRLIAATPQQEVKS